MKLEQEWTISDDGTTSDDILVNGSRMLIGNGYLGYRGTVEEAAAQEMPATIINGVYDRNGDKWREPVCMPNALSVRLCTSAGERLSLASESLFSHEQSLDFRHGIFRRQTEWRFGNDPDKAEEGFVRVESERFASMVRHQLLCMKYKVSTNMEITGEHCIDTDVRDINGPHLGPFSCAGDATDGRLEVLSCTLEKNIPIAVGTKTMWQEPPEKENFEGRVERFTINGASVPKSVTFCVFAAVTAAEESPDSSRNAVRKALASAASAGYGAILQEHCRRWDAIWEVSDVEIKGDDFARRALRYNLYQLQIIAPRFPAPGSNDVDSGLSIPARGLSGQTYKGAVFWDTEMFIAPYFLYTSPETARRFIKYRVETLDGARRKAREYNHRGAFYAWESQETGDDACSLYNVTDVFTGRPLRTYFRDKQIHIDGAVVRAVKEYVDATGDHSVLADGALEMVLECARFYLSWVYFSPTRGRYEVLDVTGPDEYHERVNNNAYTNRLVKDVFENVLFFLDYCRDKMQDVVDEVLEKLEFASDLELISEVAAKIYVPQPNERGVVEQFDGYFKLEDCSLKEVRSRLLDPKEYWGGANGVASGTQIIKQADVVLMQVLFPDDFSVEQKQANFEYYEPRTEHGSSLSPCVYSLLACALGRTDAAYSFFKKTAEIDITGKSKQFAGLIYIGGTHPAASGGAWLSAIRGFCGFAVKDGEITLNPHLPETWENVAFSAVVRGTQYKIIVTKEGCSICKKQVI